MNPTLTPTYTTRLPPGPRPALPGANLLRLQRDPLGFLTHMARQYGDFSCLQIGSRRIYLANHPDYIESVLVSQSSAFQKGPALQRARLLLGDGLLTSEGELHLRQRRLIQPAFHRQQMEGYARVMADQAARQMAGWQDGAILDIAAEMTQLTLRTAGQAFFGADLAEQGSELSQAVSDLVELFGQSLNPLSGLLLHLPLPQTRRFERARARLNRAVSGLLPAQRPGDADGSLLGLLLQASQQAPEVLDAQALHDHALTLLLAGHETTANALTWALYLLALHPNEAGRVRDEVRLVCGGRLPCAADLPRLVETRQALSETLRLYPPAWAIGRQARQQVFLGGYSLPQGSLVLLSQWVTQRDPRYYPDPERFDPSRWTPQAAASRPRYAYFPFGGGSRQCIGESFAWTEGVLVLAALLGSWEFHLLPGQSHTPQPSITLRPQGGMKMLLHRL